MNYAGVDLERADLHAQATALDDDLLFWRDALAAGERRGGPIPCLLGEEMNEKPVA